MNPAKAYAHLFSPQGGDEADNYRAPGQITFLRSDHVALNTEKLREAGVRYAFIGVPFDEGNVGKPGSEEGPREDAARPGQSAVTGTTMLRNTEYSYGEDKP